MMPFTLSASRSWRLAVAAMLAGLATLPALAQDKPVTLRFTSAAPPKSPYAMQIERFAADVTKFSNGSVKVELFMGAALGNEQDTVQQVARGRIDMGAFSSGSVSLLAPEVVIGSLPAFFRSTAEQDCVLDKHLAKPFDDLLAAKGVKLLSLSEVGMVDLVGKKSFANVADVKGAKLVSYSKLQAGLWQALGASSTFVGISEWSSALQTGVVEGVLTGMPTYVPSGLNKVVPVLTRLDLFDSPGFMLINKGAWDKLSAEQRAAFDKAVAASPAALMRKEIREVEAKLIQAHVGGGGQVVELTPGQKEAWRAAVAPALPEIVKAVGGQADALFKVADKARDACKG